MKNIRSRQKLRIEAVEAVVNHPDLEKDDGYTSRVLTKANASWQQVDEQRHQYETLLNEAIKILGDHNTDLKIEVAASDIRSDWIVSVESQPEERLLLKDSPERRNTATKRLMKLDTETPLKESGITKANRHQVTVHDVLDSEEDCETDKMCESDNQNAKGELEYPEGEERTATDSTKTLMKLPTTNPQKFNGDALSYLEKTMERNNVNGVWRRYTTHATQIISRPKNGQPSWVRAFNEYEALLETNG